jgi:hypothetical protein
LANVSKWLSCAEMAAIMSNAPRKFTVRNCLAGISCSGEVIERLKVSLPSCDPMKERSWWKTQMKTSQPRGSHFKTFA